MTVPVWNKEQWKEQNANGNLPIYNVSGNFHKSMLFVLNEIKGTKARDLQ